MAHARVEVTLLVEVKSSWGNDCQLDQIYRQASKEAEGAVISACAAYKGGSKFKIVGKPRVEAVIVGEGK